MRTRFAAAVLLLVFAAARAGAQTPNFATYVSVGDSLAAGVESGSLVVTHQNRSVPALIARQAGVSSFQQPIVSEPGFPPELQLVSLVPVPVLAPKATTPGTPQNLNLPRPYNNLAVPGATSIDALTRTTDAGGLHDVILRGRRTQLTQAVSLRPTFVTVWIGNNDVLQPAILGTPATATAVTSFVSNYAKAINHLISGAPGVKGVLIGVVQVGLAPVLFDARALLNPAFLAGLNQATGRTITIDPTTCTATTTSLIGFPIVAQIRSGAHPPQIACAKGGPFSPLGELFILDAAEQTTMSNTVNAYNAYIRAKADSIGFGYYDPNPTLISLRASGAILTVPNIASATAPFGTGVSLDGIHPSSSTHILVANGVIDVINAKYGTTIPKI